MTAVGGVAGIVLSGGGSTSVAPDRLLDAGRTLHALAGELGDDARDLRRLVVLVPTAPLDLFRRRREEDSVGDIARGLEAAGEEAGALAVSLRAAAEGYGEAERSVRGLARDEAASLAWRIGNLLTSPLGLLTSLAGRADPDIVGRTLWVLGHLPYLVSEAAEWVRGIDPSRGLCSVQVVALLRLAVSSLDNMMLGMAHIPEPVAGALDDSGVGGFGLVGVSRAFLGLTMVLGLLRETPVAVTRTATRRAPAVAGFGDLAARIPSPGRGGAQVRIERYRMQGRDRWVVYVGGTVSMALQGGTEPFDNASNVHGVAQAGAAAARTTLEAMRRAGISPDDPVTLVGYSQGGLAVHAAARSGGYRDLALVTFGSPTGGVVLPQTVPNLAVEIAEDPIPALGGVSADAAHGGLHRTVVTREVYAGSRPPEGEALPAHGLAGYRETAALLDESGDPRLRVFSDRIAVTTAGGAVAAQATLWRGDRLAPPKEGREERRADG